MPSRLKPRQTSGKRARSVSHLVASVFFFVTLLASLLLYSVYVQQKESVVSKLGRVEAQQTAGLVFEHLYSVMRRGWTRDQIDEVIHHIGQRLPDYDISVVRGEPVARQFGDLPGDIRMRRDDPVARAVIAQGRDVFVHTPEGMRYGFAVKMKPECAGCHSAARPGEVNGVILVGIPGAHLRDPIEAAIQPMSVLVGLVMLILFGAIFLALRARLVKPMQAFAAHVNRSSENLGEAGIDPPEKWPRELVSLAHDFNHLIDRIRQDQKLLEENSIRDPLTNLFNRRHFDTALTQAKFDADDGSDVFSVLLLDLDAFKPINDQHGHAAGDAVLVAVAGAVHGALRDTDLAARIGGDEFAIITMATAEDAVSEMRERVRIAVNSLRLRFGHQTIQVGCSIGAATYRRGLADAAELLRQADAAMYADKAARKAQR